MGLLTVKQDIEERIDYLTNCSELEFRAMYERLRGEINSIPVKDLKNDLLRRLDLARVRYEKHRDYKYTFSPWNHLL